MVDTKKTVWVRSRIQQAYCTAASILLGLIMTPGSTAGQECTSGDNGGLNLPDGFCAIVVAEGLPGPRHMVVAPNGDLFVALVGERTVPGRGVLSSLLRRFYDTLGRPSLGRLGDLFVALAGRRTVPGRGVLAIRDTDGDGLPDERNLFGDGGGNSVLLDGGYLYFAPNDRVIRYPLPDGSLEPSGPAQTIVRELPDQDNHRAKTMAIDESGNLYLSIGSPSNVCSSRSNEGMDPCPQLERRAGVWRFDANRRGQRQTDGERYATGIRNAVALGMNPTNGGLYAVVHGRDGLFQSFPEYFDQIAGAEKPAEEFIRINRGDDFGWPYCFYDPLEERKILAPEYGGDGRNRGRCASAEDPIFGFPGHWAPEALLFYTGDQFPDRFRNGVFVTFHGSWNRAPEPQAGYNVTFLPLDGDEASGPYEVFADGFLGIGSRPVGLAQAPDGSIYVSDDAGGRIWKILHSQ